MTKKFEDKWLEWAEPILRRTCCVSSPALDARLYERMLWPGYIGSNYERGRVLFVGAVHDTKKLFTEPIKNLAQTAHEWITSNPRGDGRIYAEAARKAYIEAATSKITKPWTENPVWMSFKSILSDLNLSWQDVAFCNAAKCCVPAGDKSGECAKRVLKCRGTILERLPITKLKPSSFNFASLYDASEL